MSIEEIHNSIPELSKEELDNILENTASVSLILADKPMEEVLSTLITVLSDVIDQLPIRYKEQTLKALANFVIKKNFDSNLDLSNVIKETKH